ncbi:hypothetical protein H8959_016708 [Pygathrix nigripes]
MEETTVVEETTVMERRIKDCGGRKPFTLLFREKLTPLNCLALKMWHPVHFTTSVTETISDKDD